MALRNIRVHEDPVLRKKARKVEEINERIKELVRDMTETMYDADGIGLAAPQIGVLRRVAVIDIGEGPLTLINPVIIKSDGSQIDLEGCLSLPGINEEVNRPNYVKVKYMDLQGNQHTIEGTDLLARAICHEIDHLEGILFTDKSIKEEIV
ncbi:peptide deformylase [Alkalibaculum sp. M08DMB]|uniref:Peptide deformylase n=1 Tax=Alkalibaculum sporogenes TaxID=2655001 RepID=A0A6A7K9A5_9FIRM|nr:peptide deformylase [Alkalibaculum sporogenes]MPW26030.1 peptide deformylase [Alkalibaculum sporogenes]